jgi:hypothetical protein
VPAAAEPPRTVGDDPVEEPWWFVEGIDIPKLFDDLRALSTVIMQSDETADASTHSICFFPSSCIYLLDAVIRAYTC